MTNISRKIEKKIYVRAGFTESQRTKKLENARKNWENKGWSVVKMFDGGLTKSSYLLLEKQANQKKSESIGEKKAVGILLGIGIFLLPIIFSWFTLRKGHTVVAKVISFGWLVLAIIISSFSNVPQVPQKTEITSNEVKQETATDKTLKWYKGLSKNDRKKFIDATIRYYKWDIKLVDNYYSCMGDFAYNKSESLKYTEVIKWCNLEYKNTPEKFKSHFNELDAKDLSSSAAVMCHNLVENNLRSPSTADFPWLDEKIYKKGKWRYIIKSYVDSQNAYGATIRNSWHCDIQYKGAGEEFDISNWELYNLEFQ